MNIILIAIGGAIGATSRHLFGVFVVNIFRNSSLAIFPFSTLFINALGSILAGIAYYFIIKDLSANIWLKNFVMIGFLGGFTTFSAFSLDIFRLIIAGHNMLALVYSLSSIALAFLSLCLGFYLMKIIF